MNTKHTFGEWIMENPDNRKANYVIYTTEKPEGIANVYSGDNAEANAKLIAAAPEMLEVLQAIVNKFDSVRKVAEAGLSLELNLALSVIQKAIK